MKGEITVDGITATYEWWELDDYQVLEQHKSKLTAIAAENITTAIKAGFTSGELPAKTYAFHSVMYSGYWKLKN